MFSFCWWYIAAGPGQDDSVSECRKTGHMTMPRDTGYMSSEMRVVAESDCGWQITAQTGQRVQLTLAAFGGDGVSSTSPAETDAEVQRVIDGGHSDTCHEVGTVWDGSQHPVKPLVICGPGNTDRRPTHYTLLFQSKSSNVVIRLKSPASLQHLSPFVIRYKGFAFVSSRLHQFHLVDADANVVLFDV